MRLIEVSESALGLAARLRKERERLGYTQAAFAELGGVKRISQFLYEKGDRAPDTNYLFRLVPHGVDIGYILLGDENKWRETGKMQELPMSEVMRIYEEVETLTQKLDAVSVEKAAYRRKLFEAAYHLRLARVAVGGDPGDASDVPAGPESPLASFS